VVNNNLKIGNIILAHKLFLQNFSETLKKAFENGEVNDKNEFLVNKEEDEKIFTCMIQFFYTGKLEYSSEEEIITFLIICHKVINNLNQYKIKNINGN
jgi:hypothetical protein